ncbi:hypothetical protein M2337_001591 [Sphingobium sp. B2D3A]|uniref:hypothetical protein n=1 Tax=unclassified Sphingobium TaxID=2611147 RepID=UPI0022243E3C|nr:MULTISPECIES: hypothetical protein [unclassified Sphingobium]MCW2337358.1 hypothetical protein [Sphingobium sp. B2D3A]MCW2370148.1 hypothetical protein [Sphingobium sp. B11D3D]MCW2383816.1 hypothetical protein [Sphingobium sp. B2D3D]
MKFALLFLCFSIAACGSGDRVSGKDGLIRQVQNNRVGTDTDYWIEMKNMDGEWERTGLIFGYVDDSGECKKAVSGLKSVNYAREYRCAPAN